MDTIQTLAGSISSMIFMLGTFNMLLKAWRTHDVKSYSLAQIGLNNIGNLVHWLYIVSLPFGPIWILHGFFTLSTILMLVWCIMYRHDPEGTTKRTTATFKQIYRTVEMPVVELE